MRRSEGARPRPRQRRSPAGKSGESIVYGVRPVLEALRAGRRLPRRLVLRAGRGGAEIGRILAAAAECAVAVERVDAGVLEVLAGSEARTQGVLLEASPLPELSLELLCEGLPEGPRWLVVLDGVEDPRNAGAIARAAEAAGAAGLVLGRRRAPPLGAAFARASAGALEHLPVARVGNLRHALNWLKQCGFWVIGADPRGGEDLFALPEGRLSGNLAWVLGGEGRGLRPGVLQLVDHRVRIPMWGRVESLNVAAAAAVLLFEARRRGGFPSPR